MRGLNEDDNVSSSRQQGSNYGSITESEGQILARAAYKKRDKKLSKLVHEQKSIEGHRVNGDFIKSIIYGGLDGILSMFAIISGAAGGSLDVEAVLILGFSNLIAGGFSMGVGDTISTMAYREHVERERQRECWEFDNYPEGEIDEMVDIYEAKGLPRHKAQIVVETMAKYRDFFIDVMVAEELKLRIPQEDENPYKEGAVMFGSFVGFGGLPLLCYVFVPLLYPHMTSNDLFVIACVLTLLVLFLLGACKSFFSAKSWFHSGLEFSFMGSACLVLSYGIGYLVSTLGQEAFENLGH